MLHFLCIFFKGSSLKFSDSEQQENILEFFSGKFISHTFVISDAYRMNLIASENAPKNEEPEKKIVV